MLFLTQFHVWLRDLSKLQQKTATICEAIMKIPFSTVDCILFLHQFQKTFSNMHLSFSFEKASLFEIRHILPYGPTSLIIDVGIMPYFMLFIPKSLHNIYQAQDFLSTKPHKVQSALTLKCKQLPDFKRFFFKTTLYDFSVNYGFENPVRTAL